VHGNILPWQAFAVNPPLPLATPTMMRPCAEVRPRPSLTRSESVYTQ